MIRHFVTPFILFTGFLFVVACLAAPPLAPSIEARALQPNLIRRGRPVTDATVLPHVNAERPAHWGRRGPSRKEAVDTGPLSAEHQRILDEAWAETAGTRQRNARLHDRMGHGRPLNFFHRQDFRGLTKNHLYDLNTAESNAARRLRGQGRISPDPSLGPVGCWGMVGACPAGF